MHYCKSFWDCCVSNIYCLNSYNREIFSRWVEVYFGHRQVITKWSKITMNRPALSTSSTSLDRDARAQLPSHLVLSPPLLPKSAPRVRPLQSARACGAHEPSRSGPVRSIRFIHASLASRFSIHSPVHSHRANSRQTSFKLDSRKWLSLASAHFPRLGTGTRVRGFQCQYKSENC